MKKIKKKILVSGMNGVIAYELISFLKTKFYVIGIDSNKHGVGKSICDEFYVCPVGTSKSFINFLNKISNKVDHIFLYVDEELQNVSVTNNLNLKTTNKIIISPKKTIQICVNKNYFYDFFINTDVLIPKKSQKGASIAKPIHGRGSRNINIINKKIDLEYFNKSKKYIVQKFISGKEFTIDCVYDSTCNLISFIPRERIVTNGVSIVGKIHQKNKFIKFINNISKYLIFKGPINIQVIIENKTKNIYLIEINPRLSGGIIFSIKSGFNPIDLYLDKFNKKELININNKNYKFGRVYSRYFKTLKI